MDKYTKIGIDQMAMNRQRMKELEKTKDVAEYLLCKKKESTFRKFVKSISFIASTGICPNFDIGVTISSFSFLGKLFV